MAARRFHLGRDAVYRTFELGMAPQSGAITMFAPSPRSQGNDSPMPRLAVMKMVLPLAFALKMVLLRRPSSVTSEFRFTLLHERTTMQDHASQHNARNRRAVFQLSFDIAIQHWFIFAFTSP
jgi:hypothetical protein